MKSLSDKIGSLKVRCSAISMVLSNSRSNPCITEKQIVRLKELEGKDTLTDKMKEEMADLLLKKDNSTKVILSDTCIAYLMGEYAWVKDKQVSVTKELLDIPQMQKGIIVEPDSLDLLCVVDKKVYKANEGRDGQRERVYNEFLSGEVDAYVGNSIMEAEIIPDVKSIWDAPTFYCKTNEPLTTANDWQLKGYSDITMANDVFVANCLVDTPFEAIESIKWRLLNKLSGKIVSEESQLFKDKWEIIERSMKFNHLPAHQRVFKKKVDPMTAEQRQMLYDRVKVCREWLWNWHEQFQKLNK